MKENRHRHGFMHGLYEGPCREIPAEGILQGKLFTVLEDASETDLYIHEQFLSEADRYYENYQNVSHFRELLLKAFSNIGMENGSDAEFVLDLGSGAGNTVLPLLDLCPHANVIASDLSLPLLSRLGELAFHDRSVELGHRLTLLQLNAEQLTFKERTFDLIVGASILHHLFRPDCSLQGGHRILKNGGHAIFFEPFETGHMVLRGIFAETLKDARAASIPNECRQMLQAVMNDYDVRRGRDKSAELYRHIEDKWLFTRKWFEETAESCGFRHLHILPIQQPKQMFQNFTEVLLKLTLGKGPDLLPDWVWNRIEEYDGMFSHDSKQELLMEGIIILQK